MLKAELALQCPDERDDEPPEVADDSEHKENRSDGVARPYQRGRASSSSPGRAASATRRQVGPQQQAGPPALLPVRNARTGCTKLARNTRHSTAVTDDRAVGEWMDSASVRRPNSRAQATDRAVRNARA